MLVPCSAVIDLPLIFKEIVFNPDTPRAFYSGTVPVHNELSKLYLSIIIENKIKAIEEP